MVLRRRGVLEKLVHEPKERDGSFFFQLGNMSIPYDLGFQAEVPQKLYLQHDGSGQNQEVAPGEAEGRKGGI